MSVDCKQLQERAEELREEPIDQSCACLFSQHKKVRCRVHLSVVFDWVTSVRQKLVRSFISSFYQRSKKQFMKFRCNAVHYPLLHTSEIIVTICRLRFANEFQFIIRALRLAMVNTSILYGWKRILKAKRKR